MKKANDQIESKQLIKSTAFYSFLAFLQPISGFFLLPLYLQFFAGDEYAIFTTMTQYSTLLHIIGALSISSAFFTFYYDYHREERKLQHFLSQIIAFTCWSTFILGSLMLLSGDLIFKFVFKSEEMLFYPYGAIATVTGLAQTFVSPFLIFFRNKFFFRYYALLSVSNFLLTMIMQLLLIVVLQWGIMGALLGKMAGMLTAALITFWYNRKNFTLKVEWIYFKEPFRFLKFFLPVSIITWLNEFVDRLAIEQLLTLVLLGVYNLLTMLSNVVAITFMAVRSAILPFLYETLEQEEPHKSKNLQRLYRFYLTLVTLALAGLVLLVANIHFMTDKEDYLQVKPYIFIYSLGYLFASINFIIFFIFIYYKKSKTIFYYTIFSLVLGTTLYFSLGRWQGLWGVVYASLITKMASLFIVFPFHAYLFKPFNNARLLSPLFIVALTTLLCEYLRITTDYSITFLGILYFFMVSISVSIINFDSLQELVQMIGKRIKK